MAYNIAKVKKEFIEVCEKAGSTTIKNIPIQENGRLTRTLGRVVFITDAHGGCYAQRVEFSKQFLATSTDKSIRDVILHEAAHFLATERTGEHHGHDAYFKSICAELGTTNDKTSTSVERTVSEEKLYKYTIYCNHCGKPLGNFTRMCKTIRNIEDCSCKLCGSHDLKVIQNY